MPTVTPRPVCVLGGGRSGTSLLARTLILLGVDFGPEERMAPANELNPRGFWELSDVCVLNDDVRATWGGRHFDIPRLSRGWERAAELDPFRERIAGIVERWFAAGGRRWGFKHAGNSFTAPLWRSAVGELDYVICVRNPLEVMASGLAGADRLLPDGEPPNWQLWTYTYAESLRNSSGARRTFVFYDDWFVDPVAVVDRLAEFLYGEADRVPVERRADVAATVDDDLHRQRASEIDLATAEHVPVEVRALYFVLRDLAGAEASGDDRAAALEAMAQALDHRWPPAFERVR